MSTKLTVQQLTIVMWQQCCQYFSSNLRWYFILNALNYGLVHGCAIVAHCVTARWRNFSHYYRPLRQYDVWFTCFEHREALPGALTGHGVQYTNKSLQWKGEIVLHSEQVGRLLYVTAVDGELEAFPLSIVICAPVVKWIFNSRMFCVVVGNQFRKY